MYFGSSLFLVLLPLRRVVLVIIKKSFCLTCSAEVRFFFCCVCFECSQGFLFTPNTGSFSTHGWAEIMIDLIIFSVINNGGLSHFIHSTTARFP